MTFSFYLILCSSKSLQPSFLLLLEMKDNHRLLNVTSIQHEKVVENDSNKSSSAIQFKALVTSLFILSIFGCRFIHRFKFSLVSSIPFSRLLSTQSKSIQSEWSDVLLSAFFNEKKSTPHREFRRPPTRCWNRKCFLFALFLRCPCGIVWHYIEITESSCRSQQPTSFLFGERINES